MFIECCVGLPDGCVEAAFLLTLHRLDRLEATPFPVDFHSTRGKLVETCRALGVLFTLQLLSEVCRMRLNRRLSISSTVPCANGPFDFSDRYNCTTRL